MTSITSRLVKMAKDVAIEDQSLYTKFVISSIFMFAIPLALISYLVYLETANMGSGSEVTYARFVVLLIVVSGLVGYIIIRRSVNAVLRVINKAKAIAAGQEAGAISVAHDDELKDLAGAFNHITSSLENKIKELENSKSLTRELFQKIEHAITSTHKIEALLILLTQSAQQLLRAQAGFVALYDLSDGKLSLKAYSGPRRKLPHDTEFSCDTGTVGAVIASRRPMIIKESAQGSEFDSMLKNKVFPYSNMICVPIIAHNEVKGVFAVMNLADISQAENEDVFLMDRVAGSAAAAIENFELNENIEETYYQTLLALARVVEAKDHYSAGHLERVSKYVEKMADRLKLDEGAKKVLIGGAVLHDLGKVGIRDDILRKESAFSEEEYDIMKDHSIIGENILKPLRSMSKLSDLVRHHHELYDGTGYPDRLKGDQIPLLARVLTIADMYDGMTSDRPYRKAMTRGEAIKIIESYAGNKLDPELAKIFVDMVRDDN